MIDYGGLVRFMLEHSLMILAVFGVGGLVSLLGSCLKKHNQSSKGELKGKHEDC